MYRSEEEIRSHLKQIGEVFERNFGVTIDDQVYCEVVAAAIEKKAKAFVADKLSGYRPADLVLAARILDERFPKPEPKPKAKAKPKAKPLPK